MRFPQRIVCLTTEPTEVLYLLGEQQRIAGISGFTTRPAIARKEKPRVAAFTSANIDKILALNPDLVLGFSNLQADIAAELVRAGIEVHIFNQRSIEQMLNMVMMVGSLVGATDKAAALVADLETKIERARDMACEFAARPVIYFEEWNDPLISGIRWVSELIEIAGGSDCFAELAQHKDAKNRTKWLRAGDQVRRYPAAGSVTDHRRVATAAGHHPALECSADFQEALGLACDGRGQYNHEHDTDSGRCPFRQERLRRKAGG